MLSRVLSAEHQALLKDERECLNGLQRLLARIDAAPARQEALADAIRRLDELFLLVIVGEFNSGKSTFINALVGAKVLEEGATPTTRRVQVLTYGPSLGPVSSSRDVDVVQAPVEAL